MILYQNKNSVLAYNVDIIVYPDFRYVPNLHRDFELVYVMEGELSVTIDGRSFVMKQGEMCLVLSNQVHGFETPVHSKVWVCVFAEDYVRDFASLVKHKGCDENKIPLQEEERHFLEQKLIYGQCSRLDYVALLSYVCALFYHSRSFYEFTPRDDRLFHRILEFISLHYTENVSQGDMAKALGYEPHYLSRYLNGFFGKNFKQLLHEYRINYAKQLIASGEHSMARIAMECGFQSIRNFNRVYLRLEKEEPRQTQRRLTGQG